MTIADITDLHPPETLMVYASSITRLLKGNLPEDQAADLAIIVINDLQKRIDSVVEVAEREIKNIQESRVWLMRMFEPLVLSHAASRMKKKQDGSFVRKNYRTSGGGGVFFTTTGGVHKLVDEPAYKAFLQSLSLAELKDLGGEFSIDYHKRLALLKEGVFIPGYEYQELNALGKMRYGTDKAWSPSKLTEKLKLAIEGKTNGNDDIEPSENQG